MLDCGDTIIEYLNSLNECYFDTYRAPFIALQVYHSHNKKQSAGEKRVKWSKEVVVNGINKNEDNFFFLLSQF